MLYLISNFHFSSFHLIFLALTFKATWPALTKCEICMGRVLRVQIGLRPGIWNPHATLFSLRFSARIRSKYPTCNPLFWETSQIPELDPNNRLLLLDEHIPSIGRIMVYDDLDSIFIRCVALAQIEIWI